MNDLNWNLFEYVGFGVLVIVGIAVAGVFLFAFFTIVKKIFAKLKENFVNAPVEVKTMARYRITTYVLSVFVVVMLIGYLALFYAWDSAIQTNNTYVDKIDSLNRQVKRYEKQVDEYEKQVDELEITAKYWERWGAVKTFSSNIYHKRTCYHLKNKSDNDLYPVTTPEALIKGFEPCKDCY